MNRTALPQKQQQQQQQQQQTTTTRQTRQERKQQAQLQLDLPAAAPLVHGSKLMGETYVHSGHGGGKRAPSMPRRVGLRPRDGFEGPAKLHVIVHSAAGLRNVQVGEWVGGYPSRNG